VPNSKCFAIDFDVTKVCAARGDSDNFVTKLSGLITGAYRIAAATS